MRLNILHTVENYYPSIGGMQEVVRQISERLAKLGHNVTIATSRLSGRNKKILNGLSIKEFNIGGNMVEGMHGDINIYKNFLLTSNFDIITNFAAQQWATDIILPLLDKINAKKIFIPTGFSAFYNPKYKKYYESMKSWMEKYDMNIFLSNDYRDINFALKNGIKKIKVIPNGACEKEFLSSKKKDIHKYLKIPASTFLILHVGSHTGIKGHKEAIEIFRKSQITDAAFLIIGNSFGNGCFKYCAIQELLFNLSPKRFFDKKKMLIRELTRQDTIDAYKEADLFLFTSNIECSPLVLIECMASKTPFLTTDAGNSTEIIKWSNSGILLPTVKDQNGYGRAIIKESVMLMEKMYRDTAGRTSLAEKGFKVWHDKLTWDIIANKYEKLYKSLLISKKTL